MVDFDEADIKTIADAHRYITFLETLYGRADEDQRTALGKSLTKLEQKLRDALVHVRLPEQS